MGFSDFATAKAFYPGTLGETPPVMLAYCVNALETANGIKAVRQALTKADAALEGGTETHTERYVASMRKPIEQIAKAVKV